MNNTIIVLFSLLLSIIITPVFFTVWQRIGPKRDNYLGNKIPVGAGIIMLFPVIIINYSIAPTKVFHIFAGGSILLGLVGLVDDLWGNSQIKGFKGHFKALLHGKITSGLLKVAAGGVASLTASLIISAGYQDLIINFLLIALFINTLNLFDLRPGRCLKIFFFLALLIYLGAWFYGNYREAVYLFVMVAAGISLFVYDLRARAMLGDAGSNILGFTLGFAFAIIFPLYLKAPFTLLLVFLHWYTEKSSLTEVISKNEILNYLDNLGRLK